MFCIPKGLWAKWACCLGLSLLTAAAWAQFEKKSQSAPPPAAPAPAAVAWLPVVENEQIFKNLGEKLTSNVFKLGRGGCKGTQGPVWAANGGVVVQIGWERLGGCSFQNLLLHTAGKNYDMTEVDGSFQKTAKGYYRLARDAGLVYFKTAKPLSAAEVDANFGLWENLCTDENCFTDVSVVEPAKAQMKVQETEALRQRAAACVNAVVPNPNPQPNETTQFYGECESGKGKSGLTVWLQANEPYELSCLIDGKYTERGRPEVDQCARYFPLLPRYCKVASYVGQCQSGVPDGVGIMVDGEGRKSWNGQFRKGTSAGHTWFVHNTRSCGWFGGCEGDVTSYSAWFDAGKEVLRCGGGPQGCQKALAAEPVYKNARAAADALRCDEALALDRKAQAMDAQVHSQSDRDNGARVDYAYCSREAQFARARNAKDPQAIYLAASRYESDGERSRAKTLYRLIVDKFETSPIALKAADRLTRLADVEAVESSNSNAAYQVQRSQEEARQSNYQQCINEYSACQSRCDSLGSSSSRSSCRSGCALCSR